MSIKLSEKQAMQSCVRGVLERHFATLTDENTRAAHFETKRLHDIAGLVVAEVLRIQKEAAIEREKEQYEMAAKQPATNVMGRDTQDGARIVEAADPRNLKDGRALTKDEILSEIIAWCDKSPLLFLRLEPFKVKTIKGNIMLFIIDGKFVGRFI